MIEIKHRYTGAVLYTAPEATTKREAVIAAVKAGADLAGADLAGARHVPNGTQSTDPPVAPYERKPGRSLAERAARYRELHPDVPVVADLDCKILEAVTTGAGKLEMSAWHTCDTTHCRGGWAIHLAGEAGRALEDRLGVERAAAAIYRASTGRRPWFHSSNEHAMEDIRRCAARGLERAS